MLRASVSPCTSLSATDDRAFPRWRARPTLIGLVAICVVAGDHGGVVTSEHCKSLGLCCIITACTGLLCGPAGVVINGTMGLLCSCFLLSSLSPFRLYLTGAGSTTGRGAGC